VALDSAGKSQEIPPLIPHTQEEKRRYREALARRRQRLASAARAHQRYFEKSHAPRSGLRIAAKLNSEAYR